ncbi:G-type lectin S-receptor-like serine/threonine-protein kinase LECRK4 isoform X2 [Rutidosis leptorrhynchoides]|uniref:G-type lectin S-receptor-like serine/threonine-protein kinase LECRK4 isoform X1 n=1 Tax=Rutidosis leptorrhynchoides TaxID=125765 RepID=UPI003A9A1438
MMVNSILFVFVFLLCVPTMVVGGPDQLIRPGSSLVAGAQPPSAWSSESNLYSFGFYPHGDGYVVAIWLASFTEDQQNENNNNNIIVVWTLDRDSSPLSPNTRLELTHKGELVVLSEKSDVDKSITIAQNISYGVMNNSGNFVLYSSSKDVHVVWQSFDSPTDTMLQGQRLFGGSELVSSVSKTNYSTGRFHIKMQTDGNLVMYPMNTSDSPVDAYWNTATYVSGVGIVSEYYLYLNDAGLYLIDGSNSRIIMPLYTYDGDDDSTFPVVYRATLDADGIFRLYKHVNSSSPASVVYERPEAPCDVKNYCGNSRYCRMNNSSSSSTQQPDCVCLPGLDFVDLNLGCQRNFTYTCLSGMDYMKYYNIVTIENLSWVDDNYYIKFISNNIDECSNSCLEDCTCDAALLKGGYCSKYSYPLRYVKTLADNDDVNASFFKTGTVTFFGQVNETINNASLSEVPQLVIKVVTTSKKTWVLIIVISVGFTIYSCISLSVSGFFIIKFRLLKYKRLLESRSLGLAEDLILRSYTYNELKRATNGFKQELGRGSFGTVYKGYIYKGKKTIAVKRLEKVVDEGEREFRAEMQVIGKTHHKSLVRLLGYCAEGKTERLLVYEYMSNGTLAERLFKSERLPEWCERVQIALDVARGILYLHEECETPIIHCDIKPHNILMDDFWTAKISDFGLAKLLMPDQTKTFTMVRGTRGYLAPEWQKNTPISLKVDIFSYGIVLLEIICCRKNLEVQVANTEEIVLSSWVYKCYERGQLDLLLVNNEQVEKQALERFVKVGLWCIQDEPAHRPSIKSVLLMLEGITDIAAPPCPLST